MNGTQNPFITRQALEAGSSFPITYLMHFAEDYFCGEG
jgi:hypothetical protein